MTRLVAHALAVAACAAAIAAATPARASVVSAMPDDFFTSQPAVISFGTSTLTFSAIAGALAGNPPAAVATSGSAEVSSFFGGVADFEAGASIDQTGEIYAFSAFPTAATIPNSAAGDFIGLEFNLADGLHYGYAEVAGTELVSYGYETSPNTTILTAAVPEPATIALFATGVLGLAFIRRRRASSNFPTAQ